MYSYPIIADTPGGVTAALANQANQREAAMRQALGMVLARQQENQRRRELQVVMQERQLQNRLAEDYRNRAFTENVRQFKEQIKLSREPQIRPLTSSALRTVVDSAYGMTPDQFREFALAQGWTESEQNAARSVYDQARAPGLAEAKRQDEVANNLNRLPVLRALREQQKQVAGDYVRLSDSPTYNLWNWLRGESSLGPKDFEPGFTAGDRRLSERTLMLEPEKKYLRQDPRSLKWLRTTEYPAGSEPIGHAAPSVGQSNRGVPNVLTAVEAAQQPRPINIVPRMNTNALVRMLGGDDQIYLVRPENVELAKARGAVVIPSNVSTNAAY